MPSLSPVQRGKTMNTTPLPLTADTNQPGHTQATGMPRSPTPWIIAWGVYSLVALGYFAYQSAWLSTMCLTR
jgi:hypothetical protein